MKVFLQQTSSIARQSRRVNREAENFSSLFFQFGSVPLYLWQISCFILLQIFNSCQVTVLKYAGDKTLSSLILFFSFLLKRISVINNWLYKTLKPEST